MYDFRIENEAVDHKMSPEGAWGIYIRELNRLPRLSAQEEFELARRYRDQDDMEAGSRLINAHLRLVFKLAVKLKRKWICLDLVQEGNLGLVKALKKFDPDLGIRFSHYASFWIRAYIHKFIMDNRRMIKMGTTQTQRKLYYNLNKEKQRLEVQGLAADTETLSKSLEATHSDVMAMEQALGQNDLSLDMPGDDDSRFNWIHNIPSDQDSVERTLEQKEAAHLLHLIILELRACLDQKEQDILEHRLIADTPASLREIGEKHGVTRERIRQIEVKVLKKLKNHLQNKISDFSPEWLEDD